MTGAMDNPEAPKRRGPDTGDDATGTTPAVRAGPRHAKRQGPSRRTTALAIAGALALCAGLVAAASAATGSSAPAHHEHRAAVTTITTTTTTTTLPPTTTTAAPPTTTSMAPTTTAAPRAAVVPAPVYPVAALPGVSGAGQVVTVTTTGYGTDVATVTAYQLQGGQWQRVFGPWQGYVGVNGLAPFGQKREGDGRTPTGTYGLGTFFGIDPDPGVRFPYLAVTSADYWDDDPSTPNYNRLVVGPATAGASPEHLIDHAPSYNYGAVIDYNTNPVVASPPMGSAIFFHVSAGGGTAGCVSIPQGDLVPVLRWLDPALSPRIVIGTAASLGMS
jgi:L,D-peptidoglycan transpeptidase YkuD (ErfK/YbiS/YcfS/YnhG family)